MRVGSHSPFNLIIFHLQSLRILTINVRGLGTARKHDLFLHGLNENLDYDLFFLQETRISCKTQAVWVAKYFQGQCFWSFGISKSAGVAIFVSPKFPGNIICYVHDTDGRILSLLVDLNSSKFNVINLYALNTVSDGRLFFIRLHTFFLSHGDLILGGDFNCIDSNLDRLRIKSDLMLVSP